MSAVADAACARCQGALERGDLRCAICGLPGPASARVDGELKPGAQILRCTACGAAIGFCAEAQAPRCGFCSSVMAIEQPIDPIEAAGQCVPFIVDRAGAEAALAGWLADRGWLAPRALSSEAVLESLVPLAWAAWRVNAEALVTWTADSDDGAERSAWAPKSGQCSLGFHDIVVPATRGLGASECRRLIPYYALNALVPIDEVSEVAPEVLIEQFDLQRSAARRHVEAAILAAARLRVEPHIPGSRHRNIRVACLVERQTTDRIALPAWILAYRYRGKPYRAIVHGQRREIVFGDAPIDWGKLGRLAAAIAALAAIIALIVLGAR